MKGFEIMSTHFDGFSITHSDPQPKRMNIQEEYRAGYQDGQEAKRLHSTWQENDARQAASDYSAAYLMNDRQAVQRFEGFFAGATGASKRY